MIENLFKVNLKTQDTAKALYPVFFGVPY
jgi:hypothetical protein